jgi:flagellar protein FliO/FliZ
MRLGRGMSGRHLKVIDALALGARERLLLVDVAGERVLLGLAGGRIERLHVLDAAAADGFPAALDAALDGNTAEAA